VDRGAVVSAAEGASATLWIAGAFFFFAGTVGLLRFPDVFTRLHALTKADNLGLGLIACGLAVEARDAWVAAKLGLVWALILFSSSIICQLVARAALARGLEPWRRR
jgi:multicomponent Na+:H+ antiporter subunit G